MEENNEMTVDQKILAESVSAAIKVTPLKDVMVKPLEPLMIKQVIHEPREGATPNEEGFIEDMVEKEVEVESMFKRGIVLKVPANVTADVVVGDTVYYNRKFAIDFDVVKDSQLVKPYDIVAVVKR